MSNKIEIQAVKNSNEWIGLIEDAISKKDLECYDYKHFHNIQKIGNGAFGKIYRAEKKNSDQYFALKSFFNLDNDTVKEIIHELELQREEDLNNNVIRLCGITEKECQTDHLKKYLLVMEYADGSSLRNYLKENFKNLTLEHKYKLAYQLANAVSCLHEKGIVHCNLHSGNVLVHQGTVKLADFGLSKRIKEATKKQRTDLFGIAPYIDPKRFCNDNHMKQNEKCDVYSVGVLLWEISSGQPPFKNELYDASLIMRIVNGYRENIVPGTPLDYSNLYIECWNDNPDKRPFMNQVVVKLESIKETRQKLNSYYNKSVDKLVDFISKELNEEKEGKIRKKHVLDFIKNLKISSNEIYNWLLYNQDTSNSIYLLGYLYYNGIGTDCDKQKAFDLYQEAAKSENIVAQFDLANMYREDTHKNYAKAFKLFEKLAGEGYPSGISMLGYCYSLGIGTDVNKQKAFELFQKAANLGNVIAQYNLLVLYENGEGVDKDLNKAFEFSKMLAERGDAMGINKLGYFYENGIGTDVNMQMAFESYQKAANLGSSYAQYNLALMYENGMGIQKDMNQAISWYKKSAEQGDQDAQDKLKEFSERMIYI
ncbi:kinase-like domain-containing protein [Rhizophagus diaphanus]|nr:kinase-like domain-containing protein [Rhizophagus diaphanus] [Rhizophagus sp. MUCL 43196]